MQIKYFVWIPILAITEYCEILIFNTNIIVFIFYYIITILIDSELKYKYDNIVLSFASTRICTSVLLLFEVFVYIMLLQYCFILFDWSASVPQSSIANVISLLSVSPELHKYIPNLESTYVSNLTVNLFK